MTTLVDLLADCEARDIRLQLSGDFSLVINAPRGALTVGLMDRLRAHKGELLAVLQAVPSAVPTMTAARPTANVSPVVKTVCRCGSASWRDVSVHRGQSVRRDCAQCGRISLFTVWYGQNTEMNGIG